MEPRPWRFIFVRVVSDPDNVEAEFAIIVHSKMKRRGLGSILMRKMIAYCRMRGIQRIVGEVLAGNTGMLTLASRHGFAHEPSEEHKVIRLRLDLTAA